MKFVIPFLCLVAAFRFDRLRKRRRFFRYSTRLEAQYLLEEEKGKWKQCRVITAARKGIGVIFHSQEKIDVGSTIHFAIYIPREEEPIMIEGTLRWIKKSKNAFVGGIEFPEIIDTDTFVKLSLRYSWQ